MLHCYIITIPRDSIHWSIMLEMFKQDEMKNSYQSWKWQVMLHFDFEGVLSLFYILILRVICHYVTLWFWVCSVIMLHSVSDGVLSLCYILILRCSVSSLLEITAVHTVFNQQLPTIGFICFERPWVLASINYMLWIWAK